MIFLAFYFTSFLILFPFNLNLIQPQDKYVNSTEVKQVLGERIEFSVTPTNTPTPTPTPTIAPVTPTPTIEPTQAPTNTPAPTVENNNQEESVQSWGEVKQIEGTTYSIKVKNDNLMATQGEILSALNNYRSTHGVGTLSWDDKLGNFAQGRAEQFNREQKLDSHAGFNQLFNDPNNMKNMGFMALGENSSIGYTLDGTHIIEWVYAADAPHNNNQLDPKWTHVGIGVSGNATDLVFGGKKI